MIEDALVGRPVSLPRRKHLKSGDKVLLSLDLRQVEQIIEHLSPGDGLLATLYHSRVWDDVAKVRCTLDELAQIARSVEAKETTDQKLQQDFGALSDAIAKVEQRYWVRPRLVRAPPP